MGGGLCGPSPSQRLGWLCESLCAVGLDECGQCSQGQSMFVSLQAVSACGVG